MTTSREIEALVGATPLIDTHEHLLEESTRLASRGRGDRPGPCQRDSSRLQQTS